MFIADDDVILGTFNLHFFIWTEMLCEVVMVYSTQALPTIFVVFYTHPPSEILYALCVCVHACMCVRAVCVCVCSKAQSMKGV